MAAANLLIERPLTEKAYIRALAAGNFKNLIIPATSVVGLAAVNRPDA